MPIKLIAAPHTPLNARGDLNLDVVRQQADHFVATGVSGVFVAGSTGEGHSLCVEERMAVTQQWASVGKQLGLTVIIQVGHNSQRDSIRLAAHAAEAGADAISAMAPCYFKPASVGDLIDFLAPIANAAGSLPFYFYDIPSMTGVSISSAELLRRGEQLPTLAGVKFTNNDLMQFQECLQFDGGRYEIWFGCDEALLAAYALGARGAVGSTYNFAAPLYHQAVAAWDAGDLEAARTLQLQSIQLIRACQKYGYMAAAKSVMSMLGIDCGPVRSPLTNLSPQQFSELRETITSMQLLAKCT